VEIVRTSRLVLRNFAPTDVDAVHAYASDPVVTRFTSFGPNTLDQTRGFVESAAAGAKSTPRTDYTLAAELIDGGVLIGGCGLHNQNHGQWELGYVLARSQWAKGYATELVQALAAFAFSQLGAAKVWAPVDAANAASSRVLEKSGFALEGLLRKDRLRWPEGRDTKIYGLLSFEWRHPHCAAEQNHSVSRR
jgi:[ribosomal protein S5]-alanine N-acetyltransferase